jgi:hypothetical protein
MLFSATTFSVAALTALAAAAPATVEVRQGGAYVSVGNKYSGPGCNPATLIFADPIFGNGNICQALDRFGDEGPIVSYSTLSVSPGCSGMFKPLYLFLDHSWVGPPRVSQNRK